MPLTGSLPYPYLLYVIIIQKYGSEAYIKKHMSKSIVLSIRKLLFLNRIFDLAVERRIAAARGRLMCRDSGSHNGVLMRGDRQDSFVATSACVGWKLQLQCGRIAGLNYDTGPALSSAQFYSKNKSR